MTEIQKSIGKTRTKYFKRVFKKVVETNPVVVSQLPPEQQELIRIMAQHPQLASFVGQGLPKKALLETTHDFLEGRMIDWTAEDIPEKVKAQRDNPKSRWNKLYGAIIKNSPSEESDQAIKLLVEDSKCFPGDGSLLQSTDLTKLVCKFSLNSVFYGGVVYFKNIGAVNNSEKMQPLLETVESQLQSFTRALHQVRPDQVVPLLHFLDLRARLSQDQSSLSTKFYSLISESFSKNSPPDVKEMFEELNEAPEQAWDKLKNGWSWSRIAEVVSALPTLKSRQALLKAVSALEVNLNAEGHKLEDKSLPETLNQEGLLALLEFMWTQYEDMTEEADAEIDRQLMQLRVPRKYTPSTAIELLTRFGQVSNPETFTSLLEGIDGQIRPNVTSSWIITLLALRNAGIQPGFINNMIGHQTEQPRVIQLLLNQTLGMLWLTPDGKLHPRDAGTTLKRGFLIYTSSLEPQQVNPPLSKPSINGSKRKIGTQTAEPRQITEKERLNMPFTGEVCIVDDEQTRELVDFLFSRSRTPLDIDKLFDDFDQLSSKWRQSTYSTTVIHPFQLNMDDEYMRKVAELGIEAVYVNDNKLFFVLERRVVQAQSPGETLKTAIAASLDKQGQLHTSGMDESFIGTPEQLLLNNLALHLITKPLYMSGMTQAYGNDKEAAKAIHTAVASWNRLPSRGSFPKIGVGQNNYIAVSVPGIKMTVLLGEAGK